jgi:hypothetical protein
MADGYIRLRRGERKPVAVCAAALSGTLTIMVNPTPVCTLYDSSGREMTGCTDMPVSGYDMQALTSPRVWRNVDTNWPGELPSGFYTLVFRFGVIGSDGIDRRFVCSVIVQVQEER